MNSQLRSHLEVSNLINWVGFHQWRQSYDQNNRNLFLELVDSIRGVEDD